MLNVRRHVPYLVLPAARGADRGDLRLPDHPGGRLLDAPDPGRERAVHRARQLPLHPRRPDVQGRAQAQRAPAAVRAGAAVPLDRSGDVAVRAAAGLAVLPDGAVPAVHPRHPGGGDRRELPVSAARPGEPGAAGARPRPARDRLARAGALRADHGRDRDRGARGGIRDRPVPGAADVARRQSARGGADRRRLVVPATALRDPAGDPVDGRVLRRRRRDHDAGLGLLVRLHAHAGRARHGDDHDGALHLQRRRGAVDAGDGVCRGGGAAGRHHVPDRAPVHRALAGVARGGGGRDERRPGLRAAARRSPRSSAGGGAAPSRRTSSSRGS